MNSRIISKLVIPLYRGITQQSMKYHFNVLRDRYPLINLLQISTDKVCISPSINSFINRSYSKGKSKGSKDKKNKNAKVEINASQLSSTLDLEDMKSQFGVCIDKLKDDFVKNVTLRSTVGSIETLKINLEGKDYELQELAQIVRKNPKTVVLNIASFPQAIPEILNVIQNSGLNLNPQQDGTTVFVPVPKVTKEYREGLLKNSKILFIKCRNSIKGVQLDFIKELKSKEISEDLRFSLVKQINALGDEYQTVARDLMLAKSLELKN